MAARRISDKELELDVQAYNDASGNKSEAARNRGIKRQTYLDRLKAAEQRFGLTLGKVADGTIQAKEAVQRDLPKEGHVKRYLLSSVQNNTHLHPGFNNLLALNDWLDDLEDGECELILGTYSYQTNAYGPSAVKRGKHRGYQQELWYAPEAEQFIADHSVQLAPGLVWCGEQNILPTTKHPLTSMEDYNGRLSNIVPHSKIAMESVASMVDEATKFNYSTGTVTQRNYIQKRAGIIAEKNHDYGAVLVEVDHEGNWWVRQLYIDDDDSIMDVGPRGYKGIRVQAGQVTEELVVAGINWGDAHTSEMQLWIRELAWGDGGMLDTLQPGHQFMNDLFSMRSRGHWEEKNFHRTYEKHVTGEDDVEGEINITADFLNVAERDFCETVVVVSNHDRHLDRWLNETDFRKDPLNAKYFCKLQYEVLDAMDKGDRDFNVLAWALRDAHCPGGVRFLGTDESFIVVGVENGLHGDLGPNGARGSTQNLTKLGRPVNKGHDHNAAIRGRVFSAGTCAMHLPYEMGPSSHSVSHIVSYNNSARTLLTMWANKWRA